MSLSEVKEKLYKREEDKDLSKIEQTEFDARKSSVDPKKAGFENSGDVWREGKDDIKETKNKAIKIGGIVFGSVLIIAILLVGFYFFKKTSFSTERVTIEFSGSESAASGEKLSYEILIENNNRAKLKNAVLKVNYPESFVPEDNPNFNAEGLLGGSFQLGDIEGKEKKKIIFNGRVYSPKGTIVYLKTDLIFYPTGFSGQFSSNNQLGLNIVSSPISLSLLAPQNISSGDSLEYLISYKNESNEDYNDIKIRMEYPNGFIFSKSSPIVSEGENTWYIGRLSAGQEGKISVSGRLEGENGHIKNTKVYVGQIIDGNFIAQNEEKTEIKIKSSPLSISQTVNGLKDLNANAGQRLNFRIYFKNEGEIGLKDVVITEKIDSSVLDYGKMRLINRGSFDAKNKTITWRASDVPSLKNLNPGDSGKIDFEISVKDKIPLNSIQDKNFVISSIAKIDSPDIQTPIQGNKVIAGNRMDIKLNSKLVLDVKGFYYDTFVENSGPIPPKVGEETSYVIKWSAINVSNDVSETKVQASLAPMTKFTGKIYPEDADLTFNERTNSIVWNIGNLDTGSGILTTPKEVSFQVTIIPAPNQKGSYGEILDQSIITGKDLFTKSNLSFTAKEKTTYLSEDKKIRSTEYRIRE